MSSTTKRSYVRTIFTAIVGTCVALIALAAPASASGPSGHQVPVGFVWQNNSSIYNQISPNGRNVFSLVQEDPATVELAVRHDNSAALSWQSGYHFGARYAVWQHDGNLVIYIGSNNTNPAWASNTSGVCGNQCTLWVQDDGNVVIYKGSAPVWATGTNNL